MKPIPARALTPEEAAVVRATLNIDPGHHLALDTDVDALQVHGLCECGCRTLYFLPGALGDRPAVEGRGRTANGRSMEIMLWEEEGRLACLDLVDHENTGLLPTSASISSWSGRDE